MLTFEQACTQFNQYVQPITECEEVPLASALGRVLASDVVSSIMQPPWDNSAMDGYAVNTETMPSPLPISQRIPAGVTPEPLQQGTAARIFTGAPIPPGADAVVMQENCDLQDGAIVIRTVVQPGENIRRAGEDVGLGACILQAGTRISPVAVGLSAVVGHDMLSVYRRLRVAILTTGDELVAPGQDLPPGKIFDSNSALVQALTQSVPLEFVTIKHVADHFDATKSVLAELAATHDVVITTGGVSVGEEDHVKPAVEALGEIGLWKVAIKPGKPIALGRIDKSLFVGLPGNPSSALVTFLLLVKPALLKLAGVQDIALRSYPVAAGFSQTKPGTRREFVRVQIHNGRALKHENQSSGMLSSALWADGLLEIPENQAVAEGDVLRFFAWSDLMA